MNYFVILHENNVNMTRLILARHGQTYDNLNQIMQGQTQGELTEEGRKQARELADALRAERIDAFVSSDLKRSIDTCRIIIDELSGKSEVLENSEHACYSETPLLRERDWGGFTGKYIPSIQKEVWPDDIETLEALKLRAAEFLDFVRTSFPEKTVLAVGHGIINKAIQAVYYKKTMPEISRMENAEYRILDL